MNKKWFLGLDIGSNSVGFSATDTEYNILTKNGKLQCGSRLFEDAEDASKRRVFRSNRRRLARRKNRVNLLQYLFNEEIAKKDSAFFIRLNESSKHFEDKTCGEKYPLFNDKNFTDKEYYKKFPTIYHLRKHLLENNEYDARLLYLACHHIIKYRGHFLNPEFNAQRSDSGYKQIINNINHEIENQLGGEISFDTDRINDIRNIITDKNKKKKSQSFEIQKILNPSNDRYLNIFLDVMNGNKISLSKIWNSEDYEWIKEAEKECRDELKDFKFSSEKYDVCLEKAADILKDDEKIGFIILLKKFYDSVELDRIMIGASYISEAMLNRYNEHSRDLILLKKFIKDNVPNEYNHFFRKKSKNATYFNYIGSSICGKKFVTHYEKCGGSTAPYEAFLKYTRSVIEKAKDNDGYQTIIEKIDEKTLCRIHNTQENAYIPYQLNEVELQAILSKQKNNFEFLNDDIIAKIISLITFKIPYYVGPLSDKDCDKFAWVKRNDNHTKITPWNFEEIVDLTQSGENFISRMTAKCTYLKNKDVIPKQSLLYQKFMLLNDLNNLKINGARIQQDIKMLLYKGLCQNESALPKAKIKKYLIEQGVIKKSETLGNENENDIAFNSSLSSSIKFKKFNLTEEMQENIIKWHTVFSEEKIPVIKKMRNEYGHILNEEQIDKLGKMTFKGWSRLSHEFLTGITVTDKSSGETGLSILKILEETTLNLMEILNSENYAPKFVDLINSENNAEDEIPHTYDGLVKDLYCSPIVKRSIWQACLISKELAKINGCKPEKVFIEVTRGEDKNKKGKMTSSRRKQLQELFNKIKDKSQELIKIKAEFEKRTDEREFRSDKLYFYFTQLGKCMYSGEPISLEKLNTDLYDIDHIYPQSKIKDDSLTNRVLVKRIANAEKKDDYPLDKEIQFRMHSFWSLLKTKGLISSEKYGRLINNQPLSQDIIGGFINRQLVSTNQAVKETAKALCVLFDYSKDKIVYSKAGNVSDFRNRYELVKCRKVNNLHHAHDAYLNIIVGNVWNEYFKGSYWKTNTQGNEDKLLEKLFKYDRNGIWQVKFIDKIKSYLFDNKKYLDKYPVTTRTYEKKGAFYDQTIHPAGKGQFELHEGLDTKKYGGYKDGQNAYNCIIEFDGKKDQRTIKMFSVPVRYAIRYTDNELLKLITKENKIEGKNPKLIIPKLQMFSILEIDGIRYHVRSGVSDGRFQCSSNAEWYPDKEIIQIIKDIYKYKMLIDKKEITPDLDTFEDIVFATRERNPKNKEGKKISRGNNLKVYDAIIEQVQKPFYSQYKFFENVKKGKIEKNKFVELKTYDQVEQIFQLLNLITMNGCYCNALKIGGSANETCKYRPNSNISGKDIFLITQSVTGLFEKRIPINKSEQ